MGWSARGGCERSALDGGIDAGTESAARNAPPRARRGCRGRRRTWERGQSGIAAAQLRRLIRSAHLDKSHSHLTAEFSGVPAEQLRDAALLGGLLIAAASAAGFSLSGVPVVREHPGGVSAIVLLDHGHLAVHSLVERRALLFDAVAPASHDFRKALDVLSRRITARDVKTDTRGRG
jgi:S-adenosylmethionine/arginine decarboxylase-like enzyme